MDSELEGTLDGKTLHCDSPFAVFMSITDKVSDPAMGSKYLVAGFFSGHLFAKFLMSSVYEDYLNSAIDFEIARITYITKTESRKPLPPAPVLRQWAQKVLSSEATITLWVKLAETIDDPGVYLKMTLAPDQPIDKIPYQIRNLLSSLGYGDIKLISDKDVAKLVIDKETAQRRYKAIMAKYGAVDYDKYLASKAWKQKRKEMLAMYPQCAVCGATKRLEVHHLTYAHLGNEPLEDLKVICKSCHKQEHGREW